MDINTGWYFQGSMRIAGYVFLLVSLPLLIVPSLWAIFFALCGIVILTTRYGLRIDAANRSYQEYTWFLGFRRGEWQRYEEIKYLFLKTAKVSRTYNSRVQSSTISTIEFNGYLKFSEEEKIHLVHSVTKRKLLDSLIPIANGLGTTIVDYTVEPPQIVETKA
jgi:hypothetical protein